MDEGNRSSGSEIRNTCSHSSVMGRPPRSSTTSKHCETQASLCTLLQINMCCQLRATTEILRRINCFLYPKRTWRTRTALICRNKCKSLELRAVNTWQSSPGHGPIVAHYLQVPSATSA